MDKSYFVSLKAPMHGRCDVEELLRIVRDILDCIDCVDYRICYGDRLGFYVNKI